MPKLISIRKESIDFLPNNIYFIYFFVLDIQFLQVLHRLFLSTVAILWRKRTRKKEK